MIALKLVLLCVFIFFWLRSKRVSDVEVSDIFSLSFLTIYLPGWIFIRNGMTTLNGLKLSDQAANSAEIGMLVVLGLGSAVYALRGWTEQRHRILLFLGGYAAFGMMGLAAFTVMGFAYLWLLDLVGRRIRLEIFRATYLATLGANVLFLNQIALQTALVTYGLVCLPLVILILDEAVAFSQRNPAG